MTTENPKVTIKIDASFILVLIITLSASSCQPQPAVNVNKNVTRSIQTTKNI